MTFGFNKGAVAFKELGNRALRLLYGYDIFISYTRADSREYAAKLYEQLTSLDYSCFIDRKEVPGGSPLNNSLISALKASKTYVLVGTQAALGRDYVKLEFKEFARTGRPIIPISVDAALSREGILSAEPWKIIKERDIVWLDETAEALEKHLPSPDIYESIQSYFTFTRRNVKRRRLVSAVTLSIIAASLLAVWQGTLAAQRLRTLNVEIERAQKQKEDYDRQLGDVKAKLDSVADSLRQTGQALDTAKTDLTRTKTALGLAERETEQANQRREVAEANTRKAEAREETANAKADKAEQRARANATVLTADAAPDPLTSVLLLTELPRDEEPADGMRVARRLASMVIPRSVERGHTARLTAVAFSPDEKSFLTSSADGTARVWDVDGRRDPVILRGHTAEIRSAVFNADGSLVATASKDGTVRLWQARDGKMSRVFTQESQILNAQFTFDGEWLVTTSERDAARLWRTDGTGSLSLKLPEGRKVVRVWLSGREVGGIAAASDGSTWKFALAPDGRLTTQSLTRIPETMRDNFPDDGLDDVLFSADGSRVAIRYNKYALVQSTGGVGSPLLLEHDGLVNSIDFNADGSRLVTASSDGSVRVWSTEDGKPLKTLDTRIRFFQIDLYREQTAGPQELSRLNVSKVMFTHDGKRVLTFSDDGVVRLWSITESVEPTELRGHAGANIAAFNLSDTGLVTGADDGTARVWSLSAAKEPLVFSHPKPVYMSSFSPDGMAVATASGDGSARLWRLSDGALSASFDAHAGKVASVVFDSTGKYLLTAHADGVVRLWSVTQTDRPVKEFASGGKNLGGASFSPDESRILTWSEDGVVKIFAREGAAAPVQLDGPKVQVWRAVFSRDGSRIVTAYDDGSARVWDAKASGKYVLLAGDHGHKATVFDAAFSPDGSKVVTVSKDGTARIWRSDGKGEPVVLQGAAPGEDWLEVCAFSPDGTKVVTTSGAGRVWVWPADGVGEPLILRRSYDLAHVGSVSNVAFSPDGQRLVTSGSVDGVTCIWKITGGKPVVLQGHAGTVTYAGFSPDGSRIITASEDGTAKVWRADWPGLLSYLRNATTATLTPEQRITLLDETEQTARKLYEQTEHDYGRTPLPAKWRFNNPF